MTFPYRISDRTVSVVLPDGTTLQTERTNPLWAQIKEALNSETTAERMRYLFKPINAVADAVAHDARITIVGGQVFWGAEPIDNVLTRRMLDIMGEGLSIEPWVAFTENCYNNPREELGREELYEFLEESDLPITQDGCFIAYKKVRENYTDTNSGTFDNTPGQTVIMPGGRDAVDPDRSNECSRGLHFCSKGYLPHFGSGPSSRVVLVKINPADVVAIPRDYNMAKGRTWRYEVVGEIDEMHVPNKVWEPISTGHEGYYWGYDDNDPDNDDLDDDLDVDGVFDDVADTPEDGGEGDEEDAWDLDDDVDNVIAEDDVEVEPVLLKIETVSHGDMTPERFMELLRQFGGGRAMARGLGVSAGTISAWKVRLFPSA